MSVIGSAERYIILDSASFPDTYPENDEFRFTSTLLPPIDNFNYDLEMAVLCVHVMGPESQKYLGINLECDAIEKYQSGDKLSQVICVMQTHIIDYGAEPLNLKPENVYVFNTPQYFRLSRNIFTTMTFKRTQVFPENPSPFTYKLAKTVIHLHVRRTASREVGNIYMRT